MNPSKHKISVLKQIFKLIPRNLILKLACKGFSGSTWLMQNDKHGMSNTMAAMLSNMLSI